MSPLKWGLGRITALHPGQDGVPRVATVLTQQDTFKILLVKQALSLTRAKLVKYIFNMFWGRGEYVFSFPFFSFLKNINIKLIQSTCPESARFCMRKLLEESEATNNIIRDRDVSRCERVLCQFANKRDKRIHTPVPAKNLKSSKRTIMPKWCLLIQFDFHFVNYSLFTFFLILNQRVTL